MTLFGSKKGYSKNDINFFEGFSASARKQTQILAVVVFIGIIAIGLCLAVLAYNWFRNAGVQKDIDDLNTTLASDEYAGLELKSQALQQEINEKNQYYYTLTEMRRMVDETLPAETEIVELLAECIPSDAYVSQYNLTGTQFTIQGCTFSYYDAANIVYMLNRSNVFAAYVQPNIQEDDSLRGGDTTSTNPIDVYYDYNITGNLVADAVISISHYATTETGVIALSGVSSQTVETGSTFEYTGISTYTVNGVNYSLSSVNVNDTPLTAEQFALVVSNDTITGIASGNVDIDLYYTVSAAAETTEEGSAE